MQGLHLRKYGVETTINFELYEVDGIDFRVDAAHAAGDSVIMKNEGAEASTDNGFVDEGKGYSLTLTATEMQAARVVIYLVDLTATKVWLDKAIVIETYGHASAMHSFDLDTATQDVNVASSDDIDLTATQKTSVNAEVDTALNDYDGPTRAEATSDANAIITQVDANETKIDALLTDVLTEDYAADGAPASVAELLYMIWSLLSSLKFVTTVGTSRKLDGSTAAMTFSIDDADSPTDINRSA
jgi:hypothetical protein